jgi:hypothetical protein
VYRKNSAACTQPVRREEAGVNWRIARERAVQGCVLVCGAASAVNPAALHGVRKGMMFGILAADLIGRIAMAPIPEVQAVLAF